MSNIVAARNTLMLVSPFDMFSDFPLVTSAVVYQGGAIGIAASGKVTNAAASGNTYAVGVAQHNNTGAVAGDLIKVKHGIALWDNSGTNPLTIANRYQTCWFEDDHTVGSLNTGHIPGGIVWDVTAAGVWVVHAPFKSPT